MSMDREKRMGFFCFVLICCLLTFVSTQSVHALPLTFGPQSVISTQGDGAWSVHAADLNGDGDMDVLASSINDNEVAWYSNGGTGNFGPQQVISTSVVQPPSVYTADLDGDGDPDVLSCSYLDDKVAWYQNNGSGSFGSQNVISTLADGCVSVYAADLDGDGDQDVLSASAIDNTVAWYENNGVGGFGAKQVISNTVLSAFSVHAADLDGDGDMDVLSASQADSTVAWYQNDGSGNFGVKNTISNAALGALSVYAADLDGDGDQDVLSASIADNTIAWYENNGAGGFSAPKTISTTANGAFDVFAADLDRDGDMDVLSASNADNKIAWYENGGTGNFGPAQPISTAAGGARTVYAADLDGDGDLDVLSASALDSKIAWYENETLFITASAGSNGSISPSGIVTPTSGADVTFTITPNAGFQVADVVVDGAGQGAVTSYTFDDVAVNHTIAATFEPVPLAALTITVTAGANGSITPPGPVSANPGDNVTFTITPNTGFQVADVVVDGAGQGAVTSYTFDNVSTDHTIAATFEPVPLAALTITVTAGANGSITPPGPVSANPGDNVTFTITPNTGFQVADVVVDGTSQGAVTSYTLDNVTQDHTIEATFEPVAGPICDLGGTGAGSLVLGTIDTTACDALDLRLVQSPSLATNGRLYISIEGLNIPSLIGLTFFRPEDAQTPPYVHLVRTPGGFLPGAADLFYFNGLLSSTAEDLVFELGTTGLSGTRLAFTTWLLETGQELSPSTLQRLQRVEVLFE